MADSQRKRSCRKCGASIPSFAPGGHCPNCLLRSVPTERVSHSHDNSWESRYTIVEEIGEGGFGKVFLAEQHEPVRRQVALKVIKPGMDSREVIARFEVERQTLASLDHANIAKIYDAGETADGRPAIAMEWVPGTPITTFAKDEGLGLRARLGLFMQVCQGVEHAHLHGIIHRDLKPGNLLAFRDAAGAAIVRIIDFGIAKATQQGATDATLVTLQASALGTPAYMSPEQAEGRTDVDARTDVYSLGAVLYELLSGFPPLELSDKRSLSEMLSLIQNGALDRPSVRMARASAAGWSWNAKALEGDLDWIALTALSKDRERRYQSVAELRRDVAAHLEGRPVAARPPSKRYRLKKLILRHRVSSAAIAAAVLALLGGTIVSALMAIRAGKAREDAVLSGAVALEERSRSREMFSQSDYQQGCRLLSDDQFEAGVAHLCRALRTNPNNLLAADRLLTTLAYTNFLPPLTKEAHHPSRMINVYFRNAREYVTVCEASVVGLWDRQTGDQIGEWLDHDEDTISESALSADSRHLVTGSYQGTVRVWDLDTRKRTFESGDKEGVGIIRTVDFVGDHCIAMGSSGGWIRVWDYREQKLLWEKKAAHGVEWIDASPDGRWLAVSGDTKAYVLDSLDGSRHAEFPHLRLVRRTRFGPTGDRVLTASLDNTARVWNAASGQPMTPPMRHDLSLYDASWAPGGARVATSGYDSNARVWSAASGAALTTALRHEDHVYQSLLLLGGKRLITGSRDQRLRMWDPKTSQLVAAPVTLPRSVSTIALDNEQLLVGGRHEQVRLLDPQPRAAKPIALKYSGAVRFAQSQDNGKVVRTLYRSEKELVLERREASTGKALGEPLSLGLPPRLDAAKGNDRLVVKHGARNVRIYASTKGDLLVPPIRFPSELALVEIDQEGRYVFLCGSDGKSVVLKLDEPSDNAYGLAIVELDPFQGEPVDDVIMLGQPLQIAIRRGSTVRIYKLGEQSWMPEDIHHPGGFGAWDFNPQHRLLITGGYDDTARLWDTVTGQQLGVPLEHADANSGKTVLVKLSPDGRFAVTSSWHELGARIWNTADGSLVTNPLYQNGHIESLAIDPRSRYLATTDDARTLHIWSLTDGRAAAPVQRHSKPIRKGRFAPDGRSFLAVDEQSALIWPLPAIGLPAEDWVVELSERIVGRWLDNEGVLHWLPDAPHADLRANLAATGRKDTSTYMDWLKWIVADPQARAPSPPLLDHKSQVGPAGFEPTTKGL